VAQGGDRRGEALERVRYCLRLSRRPTAAGVQCGNEAAAGAGAVAEVKFEVGSGANLAWESLPGYSQAVPAIH
jgi:hypothetical protein